MLVDDNDDDDGGHDDDDNYIGKNYHDHYQHHDALCNG